MAINLVPPSRTPDYKDFDLLFDRHPVTKDLLTKTGVDAITAAVKNLVLTNFYERPFRSYIGSNATKMLFENINPITATFLKNAITETIVSFEPRVELINVEVGVVPDQNKYDVRITFRINNTLEPIITNLFLERLR